MKKSLQYTLFVSWALLLGSTVGATEDKNGNTMFEAPVFLKVGNQPMNADGRIMYPSPAVFDIDSDGKSELILGSIFGELYACEDKSNSQGEHLWSAPVAINSSDGNPLKLNNW